MIGLRNYGVANLIGDCWQISGEPQMLMLFKRMFRATDGQHGVLKIAHTPANAELIEWFVLRYPLEMSAMAASLLANSADTARRIRTAGDDILKGNAREITVGTKIPLRHYQTQAVQLLEMRNALLVGDDLGLGKTCIALGAIAIGMQPAIIVCQTHLQRQWVDEAHKFLSDVKPHIVKKGTPYELPEHNLLVITYSKLSGWADHLLGYKFIGFDEVQELRISNSNKYMAASHLSKVIPYRLGLTATPVYNYGDEIFTILDCLTPDCLGQWHEFCREWCSPIGKNHHKVKEPAAFGNYLAEHHLFLRRRRQEVGRELPAVTRVAEEVEYCADDLLRNKDRHLELAQTVLRGEWKARGQAALELDAMLRMQTGIAKAAYVAAFVRQLVDSGESVVLAGWHREVYTIWQTLFKAWGIVSALYTGSESPNQKSGSVEDFQNGFAQVLILSLRSGAGLNGLQDKSCVIVFGELDWSPQVHEQCIGRLNRDGQANPVTAVYLYANEGSDPVIMQVLGVKKNQSEGIINPNDKPEDLIGQQVETNRVSALARQILKDSKVSIEPQAEPELLAWASNKEE